MAAAFDCEAYGPEGAEFGALCFIAGEGARVCDSAGECHEVMTAERQRIFRHIRKRAAAGDPDSVYLAAEFTSPDQLLGGGGS